jgi:hypothetical protein
MAAIKDSEFDVSPRELKLYEQNGLITMTKLYVQNEIDHLDHLVCTRSNKKIVTCNENKQKTETWRLYSMDVVDTGVLLASRWASIPRKGVRQRIEQNVQSLAEDAMCKSTLGGVQLIILLFPNFKNQLEMLLQESICT